MERGSERLPILAQQMPLQVLQAIPEHRDCPTSMLFDRNRTPSAAPLPHLHRPGQGEGQHRDQLLDPLRGPQMGRFEVKASAFEGREGRLDRPALAVDGNRLFRARIRDQDPRFVAFTRSDDIEPMAVDEAPIPKPVLMARGQAREDRLGTHHLPRTRMRELGISGWSIRSANPDHKAEPVPLHPGEEIFPNKLPIGHDRLDALSPDEAHHRGQQRDALAIIAIADPVEFHPAQRHDEVLDLVAQNEQVDAFGAQFPLRAIEDEPQGGLFAVQGEQQSGQLLLFERKQGEEALQAPIIRGSRASRIERLGQHAETNRAHAQHGEYERGEAEKPGAVPFEMGLQAGHQGCNVRHGAERSRSGLEGEQLKSTFSVSSVSIFV